MNKFLLHWMFNYLVVKYPQVLAEMLDPEAPDDITARKALFKKFDEYRGQS